MSSQERAHTSVNGEAEAAATPSILGSLASASTQQVQPTPAPAYPNVGQSQNAAMMMTNAAAAIAAVAATMQQFSQQQQQQLQHYHQPLQHHQQQSNAPAPPPPGQNSSMAASPAALLAALQQAQQLPAAALQPDPSATAAHNHLAALAANPAVLLAALGHVQPQSAMAVAHPHHAASAHAAAAHAAAGHYHHHPHASGASSRLLNATTTAADAVTAMSCRPTNGVTASSAAATVGAAQVPVNSAMLSEMQSWKLEQLGACASCYGFEMCVCVIVFVRIGHSHTPLPLFPSLLYLSYQNRTTRNAVASNEPTHSTIRRSSTDRSPTQGKEEERQARGQSQVGQHLPGTQEGSGR